jgi:hypothetical protein
VDLQEASAKGCPLCILIRHSIIEYYIARFLKIEGASSEIKTKIAADKTIAERASMSKVFIHAEKWEDPWVLVRCSCFLGRLHLYTEEGKSGEHSCFNVANLDTNLF